VSVSAAARKGRAHAIGGRNPGEDDVFDERLGRSRQTHEFPSRSMQNVMASRGPSTPPIDFLFFFCSYRQMGSPAVNAAARSSESEAEIAASLEAEIDEAIATCGGDVRAALRATLIANAYLETELERLTEAISTGFARGRMRKPAQRVKIRV
jgi:hypothetical protein